ncbi:hypothetical protein BC351_03875 [Paenibacillus ferrarius]|uniref:Metallo-beta-lactamase domain-containing protein n=1 Tax=Paenibacillus ferrarius TaxID=1469647 RepID=A0A1V4HKS3_9BACL|nr:MBL fold metallo-hydrolase [Paenibacillus ferrarius]OPH57663.1 hypothetical protein BC351_03875 [Paenibacillus ferrarius]
MKLRLIRHATLWLDYAGVQFLIDPMFSDQGINPPIINTTNERRNPLVSLPISSEEMLALSPDAIIVTHLHPDHWDAAAQEALNKETPLYCQPGNESEFTASGFKNVQVIHESHTFKGITITRTSGQHGTGEIGRLMGAVSGFVFQAQDQPTVYLAGDTIWCEEVQSALDKYQPDVTIVNAGGAQFAVGEPITMDASDVIQVCQYAPYTKVVAVHMDTINHCLVTREDLRNRLMDEKWIDHVAIPQDGEWV